ncbi:MAG: hypothetical protein Fur007_21980 [Rhodoferax sp.]
MASSAVLVGCGGGGGLTALVPGTGGTGSPVFAQGSISGFGSVILNGITFDDTQASVQINGLPANSSDLRLGMVADVEGDRDSANLTLATARSIAVWSLANGQVQALGASSFSIMGMVCLVNANTVFDGFNALAQVQPGQRLTVWGLQANADASQWQATRVALSTDAVDAATGLLQSSGGGWQLNGLRLTGAFDAQSHAGRLVRVLGAVSVDGRSFDVGQIIDVDASSLKPSEGEAEIEGFVTRIDSAQRFAMGTIEVDASRASQDPVGAVLRLGARIEIYGYWSNGLLVANHVEFEDEQTLHEAELKGEVTQFNSIANFLVRGQRVDASAAVFSHGSASDLRNGVKVKVKGTKAGDVVQATKVEFDD